MPGGRPTIEDLRRRSVVTSGGCLVFTGAKVAGYGRVKVEGRSVQLHRYIFELANGPLEPDQDVDHQCHNEDEACPGGPTCPHRACWRLDHLRQASRLDNLRAGRGLLKPACPEGHALEGDNLLIETTASGYTTRRCRTCKRAKDRRWKASHARR